MSVSYYDLLGVDQGATDTEVRSAWSREIDGLGPTDRRFRTLNEAAEVLLDPVARQKYDARLARTERRETSARDKAARKETAGGAHPAGSARSTGWVPPGWLLALAGLVALAMVAAALWLGLKPAESDVEESTREAQVAAENAVGPVLDYDAADLDGSRERAHDFLTSGYQEEYDQFFSGVVEQNASQLGTKISTEVIASGIVRGGDDRVEVVLFIDRMATSKAEAEGVRFNDQVTLTMARQGEEWLVDQMCTNEENC